MLALKTLQSGARAPENMSKARAVANSQLQQLVNKSTAFEVRVRLAGDNLSLTRSARERRDAARAQDKATRERCLELEKLLRDTVAHISCLRRAAPDSSTQDAVESLTKKFVLGLPFPRPGEWIRHSLPVHTSYQTDDGVEACCVEELQAEPNPTEALRIQRLYYAQDSGSSAATRKQAQRIMHNMRFPDEDDDPERETHTQAKVKPGDDSQHESATLYSHAAKVTKSHLHPCTQLTRQTLRHPPP